MEIIAHRVNTIDKLALVPSKYGAEIDIRAKVNSDGSKSLILNHEPYLSGENFEEWLKNYKHGTLVLNIKEAGIEKDVLELVKKHGVKDYFLLDVEYPYMYGALFDRKTGKPLENPMRNLAVRYSEAEPIEFALAHKGLADWVWIDTNTKLPVNKDVAEKLKGFRTCLVCPERWGRPQNILEYRRKIEESGLDLTAVMTSLEHAPLWEN